jgi:hypothetical protein
MADQIAIAALTRKRAELSGEIIRAQRDIERLRGEIAALDTTIRIFDPSQVPARIRPIVKLRNRTVPGLKHGEFGCLVLTVLRHASEPLSIGEIAERLGVAHGIDITTPAKRGAIASKIRVHLSAQKPGVIAKGERGGTVVWRVA